MANLVRVKSVGIYYADKGETNPDDVEATYRRVGENIQEPLSFCEFVPDDAVFVDDYVNRQEGVIDITPNQIVREVTGLRDFIATTMTHHRIVDIGVAYEARFVTASDLA